MFKKTFRQLISISSISAVLSAGVLAQTGSNNQGGNTQGGSTTGTVLPNGTCFCPNTGQQAGTAGLGTDTNFGGTFPPPATGPGTGTPTGNEGDAFGGTGGTAGVGTGIGTGGTTTSGAGGTG